MKQVIIVVACMVLLCAGCMFVSESYSPNEGGVGYQLSASCVGYTWEQCQARAKDLCAEVGQKVESIKQDGGPRNAIVPKRVKVQCVEQ